jgi:tetratricopeptide (TPR) repeat protein
MVKKNFDNSTNSMEAYQVALENARKHNNPQEAAIALANLGFVHIKMHEIENGEAQFVEAVEYAQKIQDFNLQVKCLGLKALAYQEIKRLPDAYRAINEVLEIAIEADDSGTKCDALTNQGQILLDSGEPLVALQKLEEARAIANELMDKRRQMNVFGVLGNQSLAVASLAG